MFKFWKRRKKLYPIYYLNIRRIVWIAVSISSSILSEFDGVINESHLNQFVRDEVPAAFAQIKWFGRKQFAYFPIADFLSLIDKNNVYSSQISFDQVSSARLIDFADGELWQNCSTKNDFKIMLYYDELEVVNPLGSYTSKHKLGIFYYTVLNLPPHLRSSHSAINILAIAKYADIKSEGISTLLSMLVDELKQLHRGFTWQNKWCSLHCLCLVGDIPAVSLLSGFKEGVGFANRPCRLCHVSKAELGSKYKLSDLDLRTNDSYAVNVERLRHDPSSSKETGINVETPLGNLDCFSLFQSIPFDIMHTLNEGIIPKVTMALFKAAASQGISIRMLCNRLNSFFYGRHARTNKPSNILPQHVKDGFRQSASQWSVLSLHLPLIIGDQLADLDEFKYYLLMMRVANLMSEDTFDEDKVSLLQSYIETFLVTSANIFGRDFLTPKFHYLLHFPTFIGLLGPPIRYSCMRFEAKHSSVKKLLKSGGSFKNIVKHVSGRISYATALSFSNVHAHSILQKTEEFGKELPLPEMTFGSHIFLLSFTSYSINSIGYYINSVICIGRKGGFFVWAKIAHIVRCNCQSIHFVCNKLSVSGIDEVKNSWITVAQESHFITSVEELEILKPTDAYFIDGLHYIPINVHS